VSDSMADERKAPSRAGRLADFVDDYDPQTKG